MATSKTLTPTNVTIQIPEFTDQPDQRVNSNCIDKEADAINALNGKFTPSAWTKVSSSVAEIMYRKVGNLVEVNVANYTVSNTSEVTLIGTLPTGYRPSKSVYQFATSAAGSTAYIRVQSNGDVGVYRSTSGAINGHMVFAVEI